MTKLEQLREAVKLREKATEGPWAYIVACGNLDLPAILAVVEAAMALDGYENFNDSSRNFNTDYHNMARKYLGRAMTALFYDATPTATDKKNLSVDGQPEGKERVMDDIKLHINKKRLKQAKDDGIRLGDTRLAEPTLSSRADKIMIAAHESLEAENAALEAEVERLRGLVAQAADIMAYWGHLNYNIDQCTEPNGWYAEARAALERREL